MNRDTRALTDALIAVGFRHYYGFQSGSTFCIDRGGALSTVTIGPTSRDLSVIRWPTEGTGSMGDGPAYVGPFSGRGWAIYTATIARAVARNWLTTECSSILLHALGNSARERLGWRNRYAALEGNKRPRCEALAAAGLMTGEGGYFWVTEAGMVAVGIDPKDVE